MVYIIPINNHSESSLSLPQNSSIFAISFKLPACLSIESGGLIRTILIKQLLPICYIFIQLINYSIYILEDTYH